MKKTFIRKPPAKKQKKISGIKDWIVVIKGEFINAAINQYDSTAKKLKAMGYTIAGYCAFEHKNDAMDWVEAHKGRYYKKERKK
jgi:hypothetical protein